MSLDYLCRWQVKVLVYCARRITAHPMCTQCSIMLHIIDICFLPCICLWQISQIQSCLCVVVGPGFVSTSLVFMRSSASHPADPHCRLAQTVNRAPITGVGLFRYNLYSSVTHCIGKTAVIAPPLVCCFVWRLYCKVNTSMATDACI